MPSQTWVFYQHPRGGGTLHLEYVRIDRNISEGLVRDPSHKYEKHPASSQSSEMIVAAYRSGTQFFYLNIGRSF